MATFYSSSNNPRDVMQALYLRDTAHATYTEPSVNGNMLYFNPSGPYSDIMVGGNGQSQDCELPISTSVISQRSSVGDHDFASSRLIEHTYNAWRNGKQETFVHAIGGSLSGADDLVRRSANDDPRMGMPTELGILNGQNLSLQRSNFSAAQCQGLSLSLGTQIPMTSFQYRSANAESSILDPHNSAPLSGGLCRDDNSRSHLLHANSSPYGLPSVASTIPNSRYLKAVQQLLDEVVNVRKALKTKDDKGLGANSSAGAASCKDNDGASKNEDMPSNQQESTPNSSPELSPSERQELQSKITKLLAMLDEVDRRYKQYFHQMQIVVSSFDVIAGSGAAKPYTALALQTISRHFRSLRDAISGQIRSTRKSLGEEDVSSSKGGAGIPRLRYIDQQLRQQRAIHQLGMMQPHAWRPQRGLPENSVSILRAWLFEHFLHPYPSDSDKLMLARQTGLTRSQVSNWFINARVRLWKPMIEDMYKEELGDAEIESNSSSDNTPKGPKEVRLPEDREELQSRPVAAAAFPRDLDFRTMASGFHSKLGGGEMHHPNLKLQDQRSVGEDCSLLPDAFSHPDESTRFMAYDIADLGNYGNGGVSLTLGLQHCTGGLGSDGQQAFPAVREDIYVAAPLGGDDDEAADYDCMNLMVRRQGFATNARSIHDFAA